MKFAIVDIETTGGSSKFHKIVEIGIVLLENGEIVSRYQTLINPEINIPFNVTLIHGITNEMVANAPTFAEVSEEISNMTIDAIFVAHSVQFDFGFVKKEFDEIGLNYERRRLCTVRLSKRMLPDLKSHSLAGLCQHFSILNKSTHRALEDAEATAKIFQILGQRPDFNSVVKEFLNKKSKEMSLPPNISKEVFNRLPNSIGVYTFFDQKGKVVYVGKANNLKERVGHHFSGNTHTKEKKSFSNSIFNVDYIETGHELMALLVENELIKKNFPRFNSSNKDFHLNYGIYKYSDQRAYSRLVIGESGKWSDPILVFKTKAEASLALLKTTMKYGLCLQLNKLLPELNDKCKYTSETGKNCAFCSGETDSVSYNELLEEAIKEFNHKKSFILKMKGPKKEEFGLIWVQNGKIKGYGFIPNEMEINEFEDLRTFLKSYYDTQDAQSILKPYLAKAKLKGTFSDGTEILELAD